MVRDDLITHAHEEQGTFFPASPDWKPEIYSPSLNECHHAPQIPAVRPDKISRCHLDGAVLDFIATVINCDGDVSDQVLEFFLPLRASICEGS